jgi:hypothetical protein
MNLRLCLFDFCDVLTFSIRLVATMCHGSLYVHRVTSFSLSQSSILVDVYVWGLRCWCIDVFIGVFIDVYIGVFICALLMYVLMLVLMFFIDVFSDVLMYLWMCLCVFFVFRAIHACERPPIYW